jgi:CBS domain-containing protein
VGYIETKPLDGSGSRVRTTSPSAGSAGGRRPITFVLEEMSMKVSDILRVKGGTLYTVSPDQTLREAVETMADRDIGSLIVMDKGAMVGMLSFREVIKAVVRNDGGVGPSVIRDVMDEHPLTCTPETEIDEVRRMMLEHHARYMPVMADRTLMGVISFYDVAKAVVESQDFENRMLKAYIRDWPVEDEKSAEAEPKS